MTLMRNGRDRRLGKPVKCHARKERVFLVGTRSADHIRASGQSGCIQRPDTWLHPNASLKRQIPLAPRAPSIHGTFTQDLHDLADWFKACGVASVAMESTGVYWIPAYEILEQRGFEVILVNARYAKNVPGRKTDVSDAAWLRQLHSYGLLRGSFRPDAEIATLRAYLRQRERLVEYAAAHIQHMQKALMEMNLQLHHVVSDITGATGMRII